MHRQKGKKCPSGFGVFFCGLQKIFIDKRQKIDRTLHFLQGNSSIGRATVSKTVCWGFESLFPCVLYRRKMRDFLTKARLCAQENDKSNQQNQTILQRNRGRVEKGFVADSSGIVLFNNSGVCRNRSVGHICKLGGLCHI